MPATRPDVAGLWKAIAAMILTGVGMLSYGIHENDKMISGVEAKCTAAIGASSAKLDSRLTAVEVMQRGIQHDDDARDMLLSKLRDAVSALTAAEELRLKMEEHRDP